MTPTRKNELRQEYEELLDKFSYWLLEGEDPNFEGTIDTSPESSKEASRWFRRMREIEDELPELKELRSYDL